MLEQFSSDRYCSLNIMNSPLYLDYNSTTPLDPIVLKAMMPYMTEIYGNPHSSEHIFGWKAAEAIENAKAHVSNLVRSLEDEIVFTSGATESNNAAIIGTAFSAIKHLHRRTIIVSEIEHKCVLGAARFTERLGFKVVKAPVSHTGVIDLNKLNDLVNSDTLLVSVMASNNEIGVNQPIKEIKGIAKRHGAIFHVDAAQAAYSDIDTIEMGIDLLSLSAHKIYGPKGIGALFISQDLELKPEPIIHGGGQQGGFRSGTMPTPLIVGFGHAAEILSETKTSEKNRIKELRDTLLNALRNAIPGIRLNGDEANRHPGNINILIPGSDARQLIHRLQPSLAISTGSACTSGTPEPSHVLKAIGLSTKDAEASLRICVGRNTTRQDVFSAVQLLASAIEKMEKAFL